MFVCELLSDLFAGFGRVKRLNRYLSVAFNRIGIDACERIFADVLTAGIGARHPLVCDFANANLAIFL